MKQIRALHEILYDEHDGLVTVLTLDLPAMHNKFAESAAEEFLAAEIAYLEDHKGEDIRALLALVVCLTADIVNRPEAFIPEFLEEVCERIQAFLRNQ